MFLILKGAIMPTDFSRISIYVPKDKQKEKPLERLWKLGLERDRSLNYMIVKAIAEFVEREEKKKSGS